MESLYLEVRQIKWNAARFFRTVRQKNFGHKQFRKESERTKASFVEEGAGICDERGKTRILEKEKRRWVPKYTYWYQKVKSLIKLLAMLDPKPDPTLIRILVPQLDPKPDPLLIRI